MEKKDLLVIGGGPAGYVAAIRAGQLGGKVTLVEKIAMGGVCLNWGCIPTRTLVRGVEFLDIPKKAKDYGVTLGEIELDFSKMMSRKDTISKTHVGGVEMLMKGNGVEVIKGTGKFKSTSEVEVTLEDGTASTISASKILIATGARYTIPSIPGGDSVITPEQAMAFDTIPQSMLIIGGGNIGFSMATIFSKLGTEITIIEESPQILAGVDQEIVSMLERELRRAKIKVLTGTTIKGIGDGDEKNITVLTGEEESTITAQYVMVAEDREASVEGLGLDVIGLKVENGKLKVNSKMETDVPGIYAAGDIVGNPMLAHVAFAEGKVAAVNAMGKEMEMDYKVVPSCIYTFPEIASVGITEEAALADGFELQIGRFPFGANGYATILGERAGMIKIISDKKYGQILGVHIIGPRATDLIAEYALAMKMDATPREIGSTIHAHPGLGEAVMEAALDVYGEPIHNISQNK